MNKLNYREQILLAKSSEELLEVLKSYHDDIQNSNLLFGLGTVKGHVLGLLITLTMFSDRFEQLEASEEIISKAGIFYSKVIKVVNGLKIRAKIK